MDTSKLSAYELAKLVIEVQSQNLKTAQMIIEKQKEMIEMLTKQLNNTTEHLSRR